MRLVGKSPLIASGFSNSMISIELASVLFRCLGPAPISRGWVESIRFCE